ncbi:MAG: phage portal protein [Trueperaceae bacterium]|nr:phage portal protein [Trueperaceae bacterium]
MTRRSGAPEIVRKIRKSHHGEIVMLSTLEQAFVGWEDEKSTPESSPHHPARVLSASEIGQVDFLRHWKPRNFLAKVIEEPVGFLGLARPRINVVRLQPDGTRVQLDPDLGEDKALQTKVEDFYQRKIRPRQADIVLWQGWYGRSFIKVAYDPGGFPYLNADGEVAEFERTPGIHVIPYPRFEGGTERAEAWHDGDDPDLITAAVVYWNERDVEDPDDTVETRHAQLLYPDRIEWLVHTGSGWVIDPTRGVSGTGIDPHTWGVVPLVECWNNGKPDVIDALDIQATINKDVYDMNAHGNTVAFPQRYRKGLIPAGGWHRNPITGQVEDVRPLKSGPHIVWDVPDGGDVGQLPSDAGEFLLAKYNGDIEDLATLTRSVAISKMKQSNDTSGESKHMDTAQLLGPRLQGKAEALGAAIRSVYQTAFAMARNDRNVAAILDMEGFEQLDVEVIFELDIDRDKTREAQMDQLDRNSGNLSLQTYLIRRGFTESEASKEVERIRDEQAAAQEISEDDEARAVTAAKRGANGAIDKREPNAEAR